MSAHGTLTAMSQPVPELPVGDVERAQAYYRDVLGFAVAWLEPDKSIGAVSRPPAAIFLRRRVPPFEPAVHWVFAEDIQVSYRELQASGANIVDPLERKPWGLWQFTVADLDGNLFHFHNDAPDAVRPLTPHPFLSAVEAQLFVADMQRACDFYTGNLGFAVAFLYGDPPHYGQVVRGNARLNLKLVCEPIYAGDIRQREHLLSASITLASAPEIEALFQRYEAAGVSFAQGLTQEPWGAATFTVADPDANLILFAAPGGDSSAVLRVKTLRPDTHGSKI